MSFYRIKRTIQVYQKALRIYNKIMSGLQNLRDIIDLFNFDPSDITTILSQLGAQNLGTSIVGAAIPSVPVSPPAFPIPGPLASKLARVANTLSGPLFSNNKVQEIMGEAGLGLLLFAMDFKYLNFSIHSMWGPDQIAQQKETGLWGIFEAKGGKSMLGKDASYGKEMSGQWISYWINRVVKQNGGTTYGKNLGIAYAAHQPMLAMLVRLQLNKATASGRLRFAFQKYTATPVAVATNLTPPTTWNPGWGY